MEFHSVTQTDIQAYQSFVHTNGAFLQDYLWGEFRESTGQTVRRFIIQDAGEIVASAQLLIKEFRGKQYISAEYGPVIAQELLTDPARVEAVMQFFFVKVKEQFPRAIFCRIEPQLDPQIGFASENPKRLVHTADLNPHQTLVLNIAEPIEKLLSGMHTKTRYNIKIAQRDGVVVKTDSQFDVVLDPFMQTAKRAKIKLFTASYYQALVTFFSDPAQSISAKVYTAWHGDDLLATNIMIYYNQRTAIYLFGGSSDVKRTMKGPQLLQWQAILDARERGFTEYDFWGINPDPRHPWYGFTKVKLGFGGTSKSYFGTYDYIYSRAWYNVYTTFRTLNRLRLK